MSKLGDQTKIDPHLWSNVSIIPRSQFGRAVATIPIAGYAILFSEYGTHTLDFESSLGIDLWFNANQRARIIYYGGLIMLASCILYYRYCPNIIKRNFSSFHSRDEFSRIGTRNDIEEIINSIDWGTEVADPGLNIKHSEKFILENKIFHSSIELSGAIYDQCTNDEKIMFTAAGAYKNDPNFMFAMQRDLRKTYRNWAFNNNTLQSKIYGLRGEDNEIRKSFRTFNIAGMRFYSKYIEKRNVFEKAIILYQAFYDTEDRSNPIARLAVFHLSKLATIFILLPMFEVMIKIFMLDVIK